MCTTSLPLFSAKCCTFPFAVVWIWVPNSCSLRFYVCCPLNICFLFVEICIVNCLALFLVFYGFRLKICSIKCFVVASWWVITFLGVCFFIHSLLRSRSFFILCSSVERCTVSLAVVETCRGALCGHETLFNLVVDACWYVVISLAGWYVVHSFPLVVETCTVNCLALCLVDFVGFYSENLPYLFVVVCWWVTIFLAVYPFIPFFPRSRLLFLLRSSVERCMLSFLVNRNLSWDVVLLWRAGATPVPATGIENI